MTLPPFTASAGIGLKAQHMAEILRGRPALGFLEVHAENYMGDGGTPHRWLHALSEHYPLSIHGVGLSLGGDEPLDLGHLEKLAKVVERYRPALVSEHLAWSVHNHVDLVALVFRIADTGPVLDRHERLDFLHNFSVFRQPFCEQIPLAGDDPLGGSR